MPTGDRPDSPGRLTWRIDALDQWRKDLDARIAVLESKVSNIVFDDKLAQELAKKLDQRSTYTFALWQKLGAGIVSLVLVAGELKTLLGF